MKKLAVFLVGAIALAGCGGGGTNPFMQDADNDAASGGNSNTSSVNNNESKTEPLNLTDSGISGFKFLQVTDQNGNTSDLLYVDNIPFDGTAEVAYEILTTVITSDGVKAFKSTPKIIDAETGTTIDQDPYHALYGKSKSGAAEFAIAKTGIYLDEGPGGYILRRNQYNSDGSLVEFARPTNAQAVYSGTYDGLLIPTTTASDTMLYTTGETKLIFDFDDFDDIGAVEFQAIGRQIYDEHGTFVGLLPALGTTIGSGQLDANGRYSVDIFSLDAEEKKFETGTVEGFLSGKNPNEAAGIIVLTSKVGDAGFKEVAGFFAYGQTVNP